MGWQAEVEDPNEFIEAVKRELFADQVFVFTPEGDIKTFPKGAHADRLRVRGPHRRGRARGWALGSTARSCRCAIACARATPSRS